MTPPCTRGRVRSAPLVALAALVLVAASCGPGLASAGPSGAPGPTPMDLSGLVQEMVKRGIAVLRATSGEAGCDDPGLIANAVHFRVLPPGEAIPRDVFLFTFGDHGAWAAGGAAVTACRTAWSAHVATSGQAVSELDVSPFRLFGAGWSPTLRELLHQAVTVAAGNGGLPAGGFPAE